MISPWLIYFIGIADKVGGLLAVFAIASAFQYVFQERLEIIT